MIQRAETGLWGLFLGLLCLFHQFNEGFDLRLLGQTKSLQLFFLIMANEKPMDIESTLPASSDFSTGKAVVHDAAVFEVDLMAKL